MHTLTLAKAKKRILELEKAFLKEKKEKAFWKNKYEDACICTLTGLPGRGLLEQRLTALIGINKRRWKSGPRPITIVFFDIDHFKLVNDTHGHVSADQILSNVAGVLKSSVRPNDLVVRYGGEEFVAVLSNDDESSGTSTEKSAHAFVDRIRKAVSTRCKLPNGKKVTVSAGVFVDTSGKLTVKELIRSADKNLYSAKDSGRNRVISSEA